MKASEVILLALLVGGVGAGGYYAWKAQQKGHAASPGAAQASKPVDANQVDTVTAYLPQPYQPRAELGIQPIDPASTALAPKLAPSPDAVLAQMQAQWEAQQKQQMAQLESQYQADLARQSAAREAETLRLQRESQAREAELMRRQEEELRRQNELIRQAEESRQRELETLRRQEEARKAAEQARLQDRITAVTTELRGVQDQIRNVEGRLNLLNSSQADPAFIEQVRAMLEARCRATHVLDLGCSNPKELGATVPVEWQKKVAADRAPLELQLATLRDREKVLLADLGTLRSSGTPSDGRMVPNPVYTPPLTTQTVPIQSSLWSTPSNLSSVYYARSPLA